MRPLATKATSISRRSSAISGSRATKPLNYSPIDRSLRVFLTRFYDGALEIYRAGGDDARGCYSISTAPAQATVDPAIREFLDDSIRGTDAFLAGVIGEAQERGEIAATADPSALAQIATATLHTIAVRSRVGASRKQLKALAAAAIDLICGPERP